MAQASTYPVKSAQDRELVFTRTYDAPRSLVFKMWTTPEHIAQWWGPTGFRTTIHEMSVKPGGVWRFIMHGPDGVDYKNRVVFLEVMEPERLVYKQGSEEGPEPVNFQVTVTFAEEGRKTALTMRMLFPSKTALDFVVNKYGAVEGAKQTLGRLKDHLAAITKGKEKTGEPSAEGDIILTRVYDAPRDLVFRAWTEPKRLTGWWAPKGFTTPACEVDLRPGGSFHYCMRSPDGQSIWGIGKYREIVAHERIVYTDAFSDAKGNVVPPSHYGMSASHPAETLVSVTFTEHEGRTQVKLRHSIPGPVEERTAMEQGWSEMLERLAENLARI